MQADADKSWYMPLALEVMKIFMLEPAQGAATSIYLASSPEVEGETGKYYVDCRRAVSSNDSYNHDTARRLWEVSQELTEGASAAAAAAMAAPEVVTVAA